MKVTLDIPEDFDESGYFIVRGEANGRKFATNSLLNPFEISCAQNPENYMKWHKECVIREAVNFTIKEIEDDNARKS